MYSFAQRSDTRCVDEPLYAHYLRVSGARHPARDLVLRAQDNDGERVIREVLMAPDAKPVLFFKQMAHHLESLRRDFLGACANVLLTRDPREMLPSLIHQIPQPTLRDTGYAVQSGLLEHLCALGQSPPVLDAAALLRNPSGVLSVLCERLGLRFEPAMLSWPAGPRAFDGVWAPHWYHNVHRSSSFEPYRPKREPFPAHLEPLLAQCLPHYERLSSLAIRS
jgi:hypothetical protein